MGEKCLWREGRSKELEGDEVKIIAACTSQYWEKAKLENIEIFFTVRSIMKMVRLRKSIKKQSRRRRGGGGKRNEGGCQSLWHSQVDPTMLICGTLLNIPIAKYMNNFERVHFCTAILIYKKMELNKKMMRKEMSRDVVLVRKEKKERLF